MQQRILDIMLLLSNLVFQAFAYIISLCLIKGFAVMHHLKGFAESTMSLQHLTRMISPICQIKRLLSIFTMAE